MISELNKYHGLPNGMFSCDEHLAGRDPSQGSELCTVVEYMFSLEQSLAITGDPASATGSNDSPSTRCPARSPTTCGRTNTTRNRTRWSAACITSHGPPTGRNRISTAWNRTSAAARRTFTRDGPSLPPACSCFPAHRRMTRSDGLVAAAYAPCEVRTMLRGTPVHIVEETDYPFRGHSAAHRQPGLAA